MCAVPGGHGVDPCLLGHGGLMPFMLFMPVVGQIFVSFTHPEPSSWALSYRRILIDSLWPAALVTAALGTASLSLCGLYCNHADLSPRYAPFLLGMTNTIGAVPGIIGVAVTGAILDATGAYHRDITLPSAIPSVKWHWHIVPCGSCANVGQDQERKALATSKAPQHAGCVDLLIRSWAHPSMGPTVHLLRGFLAAD